MGGGVARLEWTGSDGEAFVLLGRDDLITVTERNVTLFAAHFLT